MTIICTACGSCGEAADFSSAHECHQPSTESLEITRKDHTMTTLTTTTCPTCGNTGNVEDFFDTHVCTPRLLEIKHLGDMANQRAYRVVASYADHETVTTFTGTPYGAYGVFLSWHDQWLRVEEPTRFGETFDADWIRAFYGQGH